MTQQLIACCDLGGTKMLAGLMSLQGELLVSEKYLLGDRIAPLEVIEDLDAVLTRLLKSIGRERSSIAMLGMSSTGVMNVNTGIVAMNHNMGWFDVPLRALAAERLGVPVILEMDANAAALGELWRGAAQTFSNFVFVILGTGIGGGIVLNRHIWHGAHSTAGEIGHTIVLPGGPLCGCGKHGCIEALASGLAISRRAEAALKLGRITTFQTGVTAQQVAEAARAGDAVAREIIDESAYYLGIGLANLITLFDPEAIIMGGGVGAGAFDLFAAPMQRAVQQHLNFWAARETPILRAALGEQAGLYGAAYAALESLSPHFITEVSK